MHNLRTVESQANVTLLLGRGQKLNWMILPFLNFSLISNAPSLIFYKYLGAQTTLDASNSLILEGEDWDKLPFWSSESTFGT